MYETRNAAEMILADSMQKRCSRTRLVKMQTIPPTRKIPEAAFKIAFRWGKIWRRSIGLFPKTEECKENDPESSHEVPVPTYRTRQVSPVDYFFAGRGLIPGSKQYRPECNNSARHMDRVDR